MRFRRFILLGLFLSFQLVLYAQPVITGQDPNPVLVNEGQAFTIAFSNLNVNDVNYPTGYTLTVQSGSGYTASGTQVTPNAGFSGTLSVPVIVNDGSQDSAPWNFQIQVNDSPIAVDDNETTAEDTQVNINLLTNDTDSDGSIDTNTIDLEVGTAGQQTTATTAAGNWDVVGNHVRFTPALNYNSPPATLQYTVEDNRGAISNQATITVTITADADPPVAVSDATTINEDTPLTSFNILSNDSDPDGTLNTGSVDLDPGTGGQQTTMSTAAGSWSVAAGLLSFTPTSNYTTPPAVLTYTVADNEGNVSNQATITITITPVNDPPTAGNDNTTITEDTPLTNFNILANDADPDGSLNAGSVDLDPGTGGQQTTMSTSAGSWSVTGGLLNFTPALNYNTPPATLTYTVSDNLGLASGPATITITITPVNDPPNAANDNTTIVEDTPLTGFNILANDMDIDGTVNTSSVDLDPGTGGQQTTMSTAAGSWSVAAGLLNFTPTLNYTTPPATLTYTVSDNGGAVSTPATITITITPGNDPPSAVNDNTTIVEDTPLTGFNILANDSDPDGTLNTGSVDLDPVTGGQQTSMSTGAGSWSVSSGLLSFTPALNYTAPPATLTYTVNDNDGATSAPATITITITPFNDPPVAVADNTTIAEDTPLTSFNILANDSDIDGTLNTGSVDLDPLTGGQQTSMSTAAGSWSVAGGLLNFTPTFNYNTPPAVLTYTVSDNGGTASAPATITITITPVNDPPDAVDDATSTNEETAVTINVVLNDTDVDGTINAATVDLNVSTAGIQTTASTGAGSWSVLAGVVTFTPAANYDGPATLQYQVNDNGGATSDIATINITVINQNDPPDAVDDVATTNEDVGTTVNVLANDTDDASINIATVDLNTSLAGIQNTNSTPAGNWSVNTSGVVSFNPVTNFNGPATLTYTVNDSDGETSDVATITINVTPLNDAPVANGDNSSTPEETSVTFNVTGNDTDVDGTINAATVDLNLTTSGIQNSNTTAAGSWSVNSTGDITFTPVANFNGTATLNYVVNDNGGASSNVAAISVNVTAVNDPPTASADAISTPEETAVNINVVLNDTDIDGTVNVATVDLNTSSGGIQTTNSTAAGAWSVNTSGLVTFTPAADFNGLATLMYTVNDNGGATSNPATISITVTAVNDAPLANDDAGSTSEETLVVVNVTGNDTDVDGTINTATVDLNTSTAGIQNSMSTASGNYTANTSGDVSFTPAANFNGVATLAYRVNDNGGATSNSATISITVSAVNDPPNAANDAITTPEDTPVNLNLVANDTDIDGTVNVSTVDLDTSTPGIQNSESISGGTVSVNASGLMTFTPTINFYGTASGTYTVQDNSGATSNVATYTITVTAVNDPPFAGNDISAADENETITMNVVVNDFDFDGSVNAATVDLNTSLGGIQNSITVAAGTFTVDATGVVTYVPTLNFNGIASIPYTVRDNSGATSNTATITVTVNSINSDPVATNDAATILEDAVATINLIANDVDPDGSINGATVDLNTAVAGIQNSLTTTEGTFSVNGSGMLTFTPLLNFFGAVSSTYTVNDNVGATSNVATISITVTAVNDAPVANADAAATPEATAVSFNVVTNDTDVDGTVDPATVDLNTTTAGIQNTNTTAAGTFTVNNAGLVTFTPVANFFGAATLTYRVNDNNGATSGNANITVTVSAVNDPPVAANDAATTPEDVAVTVNVVSNDADSDGSIAVTTVDLNPDLAGIQNSLTTPNGAFTVNTSGVVTFTPVANFNGAVVISYVVNDNTGLTSNEATITITVTPVNDAPVAANDAAQTPEGTPVSINVATNDTDVDGTVDPATVDLNLAVAGIQNTNTTAQGTFTVNTTGVVTFTPVANFSGTATLTYRVNDNQGASSNTATITITIDSVNDPPVAANDVATTNEDVLVTINVLANDTDIDGTVVATTVDLNPSVAGIQTTFAATVGTFSVNTAGVVTFTPDANESGTAVANYTVNDNGGLTSAPATITVTVNAVNDVPVAGNDAATTGEDNPVTFNIVTNDSDPEGPLNLATIDLNTTVAGIQVTNTTTGGSFSVNATGDVTFTPVANFFGSTTLNYRVNDGSGLSSNVATITVTVTAVNDPPSFAAIADISVLRNSPQKTITITGITAGPLESETLNLSATSGNVALIPTANVTYTSGPTATLSFTPAANQAGDAIITVKLIDAGLNEFTQAFTIHVVDVRFTSTPPTVAVYGENYEYDIEITPVSQTLTIAQTQKPVWANLTSTGTNKAKLSGIPPANAPGSSVVQLQVKDGAAVLDTQQYTLVVNHRPVVTSFGVTLNEDQAYALEGSKIANAYTDSDNQTIKEVQFTKLPKHGLLHIGPTPVAINTPIAFSTINAVHYTPNQDYVGLDTLYWKASDGMSLSATEAYIHFTITETNDPPTILSVGTDSLMYELGSEVPQILMPAFDAIDVDDDSLASAVLTFRPQNFSSKNDRLIFAGTTNISGGYDSQTGSLVLHGKAPIAEYIEAVRSVQYNFEDMVEIKLVTKSVSVTLSDDKDVSATSYRYITLIYTFEDLVIPNAFTPNGDSDNEVWAIIGSQQYRDAVIRVYDKRSKMVFESVGFDNPWDGRYNGELLPSDTYYYTIDLNYNHIFYKGAVTLLR